MQLASAVFYVSSCVCVGLYEVLCAYPGVLCCVVGAAKQAGSQATGVRYVSYRRGSHRIRGDTQTRSTKQTRRVFGYGRMASNKGGGRERLDLTTENERENPK